jgi:DNA-directed RNA polymerase specialized sigma24 family protein
MFDHDPELSPDLVWLLQSQQVEDGMLAGLLVKETYAQLLPFWEALVDDAQEARLAIQETLSSALIKAPTYREAQSVRSWLIGLAIDLYRKNQRKAKQGKPTAASKGLQLRQLSQTSRLAVVLRYRLDYTPQETAQLLGEKPPATETRLWAARLLLLGQIGKGSLGGGPSLEPDPLAHAFQQAYPTPALSEIDLELISQEVNARAQSQRSRLQRKVFWKEISLISAVILVALVWLARANPNAPKATPEPAVGKVLSGGTLLPSRQPSTPFNLPPTQMAPVGIGTDSVMPTQWTPTPIPEDAFYTVQEGDTLLQIATGLGRTVEELRSLNRLPEKANLFPGEQLLIPGSLRINTPIPNAAFSRSRPTPTPLAAPLTPDEILEGLNNFYFNSFWVDLQFIYLGPQGYRGEAFTYRMQWWETPSGALILAGQNQNTPDQAIKWWRWSANEFYVARLAYGSPWFQRAEYNGTLSQFVEPLSFVFNIHTNYWNDQLVYTVVVGSGYVGDRPVYILKQYNSQQQLIRTIWVDQVSSLPLHIQLHDPRDPQYITTDMLVTGLEINPDIPEAFFNPQIPWMGGYAKDSRGDPFSPGEDLSPWGIIAPSRISQPFNPTPSNLNLATSALQFQFEDNNFTFPDLELGDPYQAEIFSRDSYLGFARLPDPFFTLCARSPDGKRMAYSPASANTLDVFSGEATPGGPIYWIDFSDPEMRHTTALNLRPFSFAFSPDGEQLAVYGRNNVPGIYLFDLRSDELRLLQPANLAYSLAWKPDGKQLAYISQTASPPSNASLVVLDVESGKVLNRQSFPMPGNLPAKNVLIQPPLQWGVPFPVGMGDLGACAARPVSR